jgi:hypothetical protein
MSGKCKACGAAFRKGTTVTLLTPSTRSAERARVCSACASGGLVVVAPRIAPVVREARSRSDLDDALDGVLRQLRMYSNMARATADKLIDAGESEDPDVPFFQGRDDGLCSAIELLRKARAS